MADLSIVIVLFNEFELVKKCIQSVIDEKYKNYEVILIDNSTDKRGHESLLKVFPQIKYFQNKTDVGFARAVNKGINKSEGEFVIILTPDMYLLSGTIKETVNFMETHENVGILGCRVFSKPGHQEPSVVSHYPGIVTQLYYYNMPFYKIARRFSKNFNPMYYSKKDHRKVIYPKAVSGQYMLIRKKAAQSINYFDQNFFLYFEDIDFCKRLIEKGWKVAYIPRGGVVQNGLSAWKNEVRITQSIPFYLESLYFFLKKHYGVFWGLVVWFAGVVSVLMSIPYLGLTILSKKTMGLDSQSEKLLPTWIKMANWHARKGIILVAGK